VPRSDGLSGSAPGPHAPRQRSRRGRSSRYPGARYPRLLLSLRISFSPAQLVNLLRACHSSWPSFTPIRSFAQAAPPRSRPPPPPPSSRWVFDVASLLGLVSRCVPRGRVFVHDIAGQVGLASRGPESLRVSNRFPSGRRAGGGRSCQQRVSLLGHYPIFVRSIWCVKRCKVVARVRSGGTLLAVAAGLCSFLTLPDSPLADSCHCSVASLAWWLPPGLPGRRRAWCPSPGVLRPGVAAVAITRFRYASLSPDGGRRTPRFVAVIPAGRPSAVLTVW